MSTEEEFISDVVLKDGSIVQVRPPTRDDIGEISRFVGTLSKKTLELRFLGGLSNPDALSAWLVPAPHRFVLVTIHEGRVVGHAAYQEVGPGRAEWSVVLSDDIQRKGLGTILLGQLIEAASRAGIHSMEADIWAENYQMLDVIHGLGFPVKHRIIDGLLHVVHPTSISPGVLELFERMEALSAAHGVQRFLEPKSVAVIGASRSRGSIGGELFHNCLTGGFHGPVYAVNATADVVQSVPAYRSVLYCPGPVDLAIVTVRAGAVVPVAEECAKKGVKAMVVISAGFAESGSEGARLQSELVEVCRESGMRLVGPNCMGLVNTAPEIGLNAQFSIFPPLRGGLGILSQSGAVGLALMEYAGRLGYGISSFVSVGNKADVSGNDLLQYWENDTATKLILLYLESFGNPRKFSRISRRVARSKPIIAVKGGRTAAGFRATQSHTGALVASSLVTVDALFRQAGVIRTDTLEQMFGVAALLASQPAPRGNRVAIVTNAGGAGILAADACGDMGLEVPLPSKETVTKLRGFLNPDAGLRNPIDMVASASPENYEMAIRALAEDGGIDAIIAIFIPPMELKPQDVASSILRAARDTRGRIPVISVFMASKEMPPLITEGALTIPNFPFPETAVRALSKAAEYGKWIATPSDPPPVFTDLKRGEAVAIVAWAMREGREWLAQDETVRLLAAYGIRSLPQEVVPDSGSAVQAFAHFGGKVVLKVIAPGLLHKSDVGGVVTGLEDGEAVRLAAEKMVQESASKGFPLKGFLVQPMLEGGTEVFVGVTHDATFGPILACGAGGVMVELLKDISVRLTPLSDREANEMILSLKTYPLLNGYRGAERRDVPALKDVMLRVANLAEDIHEVLEMDLNPLMVMPAGKGVWVVDARIRVGHAYPEMPIGAKKR